MIIFIISIYQSPSQSKLKITQLQKLIINKFMDTNQKNFISQTRNSNIRKIKDSLKNVSIIRKNTRKIQEKIHQNQQNQKNSPMTHDSQSESLTPQSAQYKADSLHFFENKYIMGQKIGQGANGFVNKCIKKKNNKIYAVKSLMMDQQHIHQLKKNFVAVKQLKCPCVVEYKALYLDMRKKLCYLVMQYVNYPNLFQIQIKNEQMLKEIFYQLLQAMQYMHSKNFCHRDLKPENVLYDVTTKKLKIIDFGTAKKFIRRNKKFQMLTITGTMFYRAPQMFTGGGHTQKVDVWGAGVLLYKLITGKTPFQTIYHSDTIHNIIEKEPQFEQNIWSKYQKSLKQLVIRMLKKNKDQRLSAKECLRDPWFYSINFNKLTQLTQSYQQTKNNMQRQANPELKVVRTPKDLQFHSQTLSHMVKNAEGQQYHMIQSDQQDQNQSKYNSVPLVPIQIMNLKKKLSSSLVF